MLSLIVVLVLHLKGIILAITQTQTVFTAIERVVLVVLAVVAFLLGMVGYESYYSLQNTATTMSDLAYLSLNLFFMQFAAKETLPLALDIARWLAPSTLSYTLIKTLMSLMQGHIQRFRLRYLRGHAVVLGLNNRSMNIALSFKQHGFKTVVIDEDEHNRYWGELKKNKINILVANPADSAILTATNVSKAAYLFACTSIDTANLNVIYEVFRLKQGSVDGPTLNTVCQIDNRTLLHALNNRPLFATNHHKLTTRTINYNFVSARWLLNEFGPHKVITNLSQLNSFSVVILSDNVFTAELILRLAEIGIYGFSDKIRIVLVGANSAKICSDLEGHYPAIQELLTLEAVIPSRYNDSEFQSQLKQIAPKLIYICAPETGDKLLALQSVCDLAFKPQIVVCETDNQRSFEWLQGEYSKQKNVHFADVNSAICHYEDVFENRLDRIAIAVHHNYVAQQLAKGETAVQNSSLVSWDELPEVLKDANRNQADHAAIKCYFLIGDTFPSAKTIRATLTETSIQILAKMEHQRWVAEKKLSGWQYTSGNKDPVKRLSPSLINWDNLSNEEKQKDIDTIDLLPVLVELINTARNPSSDSLTRNSC